MLWNILKKLLYISRAASHNLIHNYYHIMQIVTIFRHYRHLFSLPIFCCLIGCFSMELSEHISPAASSPIMNNNMPIAIVLSNKDNVNHSKPKILGHQYILGIIPFTNLFLQHSPEQLVLEMTIERLQNYGFRVFITDKNHVSLAGNTIQPSIIIEPVINSVKINAYDAIFYRILNANVTLQFEYSKLSNSGLITPTRHYIVEKSKKRYKQFAYSPALSLLLEQTVGEAIDDALQTIPTQHRAKNQRALKIHNNREEYMLILNPPLINNSLAHEIILNLPPAYINPINKAFIKNETIARIVQRGIEIELTKLGHKLLTATQPVLNVETNQAKNAWILQSSIKSIKPIANSNNSRIIELIMQVEFTLYHTTFEHTMQVASISNCEVVQKAPRGIDGYWVYTIENAASSLVNEYFSQGIIGTNGIKQSKNSNTKCYS
jgi:hypothetical protein